MNRTAFVVVFSFLYLLSVKHVFADTALGVANYYPIIDSKVEDGNIVSSGSKGYFLSRSENDPYMIGVVSLTPAIGITVENQGKTYPVVSVGIAYVRVSTANGVIKKGDFITSSKTPGIGIKATKSGYILGTALEGFSSTNKDDTKLLGITLNVHYGAAQIGGSAARDSLTDLVNLSKLATLEQPIVVFKYIVAGLTILLSFVIGFISFGRVANTGVEALGRNPLAGKLIQVGIILNVAITIAIIAAGFGIAYLVLRL